MRNLRHKLKEAQDEVKLGDGASEGAKMLAQIGAEGANLF